MKKLIALLLCAAVLLAFCGCGVKQALDTFTGGNKIGSADKETTITVTDKNTTEPSTAPTQEAAAKEAPETKTAETITATAERAQVPTEVVFYNNDSGIQDILEQLATSYTAESGKPVKIVSVTEDYENQLSDALDGDTPPAIFTVDKNNISKWEISCLDLNGTKAAEQSYAGELNRIEEGKLIALAYDYIALGVGVNVAALEESGYSLSEVTDYKSLVTLVNNVQQMHYNRNTAAAFAEPALSGDMWRYTRYMINPAIFFEMQENGIEGQPAYVRADFIDNVRSFYELWYENTNSSRWYLNNVDVSVPKQNFSSGRAVFFPCGSWELDNLVNNFGLNASQVTMIPMYMGIRNETDYGCCCGDVRYWCVNRECSENNVEAALDFLAYITGSEGAALAEYRAMPFTGLTAANPFVAGSNKYLENGKKPVDFIIDYLPGEQWENDCFSWLIKYTTGYGDWVEYTDCFILTWQDGYAAMNKY